MSDSIIDGRAEWKRQWARLHPLDQGKVEEARRMGRAAENPQLAPFVVGYVRRQRRQYKLGLLVGVAVLVLAGLIAAAVSDLGWRVLTPSGGAAVVLSTIVLRFVLARDSDEKAMRANEALLSRMPLPRPRGARLGRRR